jgi:hypothetical protein
MSKVIMSLIVVLMAFLSVLENSDTRAVNRYDGLFKEAELNLMQYVKNK